MIPRAAALVVLVTLAPLAGIPAHALGPASGPTGHSIPRVGDALNFSETISVTNGTGNYSHYSETDSVAGNLTVTGTSAGGIDTVAFRYVVTTVTSGSQVVEGSTTQSGTFTFNATTFEFVSGTDDEPAYADEPVWFYMNNSLPVGGGLDPLDTPMTVESTDLSYPLGTAAGANVQTIYADGSGTYVRDDAYGVFNATYDWRSYFDPATGYIVASSYVEQDSNGRGDGFVYTDTVEVTKTSYPLASAASPATYTVTFTASGLPAGTPWTVIFNGVAEGSRGTAIAFPGVLGATYLYVVTAPGYTPTPSVATTVVSSTSYGVDVAFAKNSSGGPGPTSWLPYVVAAVAVAVLVAVLVVVAARRARRGPRLPRHPMGGAPQYGAPPAAGPPPPPISLSPTDQPRVQQVVVKEVVKVNCRYCGSLIDSTAEKCPFCGATRT